MGRAPLPRRVPHFSHMAHRDQATPHPMIDPQLHMPGMYRDVWQFITCLHVPPLAEIGSELSVKRAPSKCVRQVDLADQSLTQRPSTANH